MNCPLCNYLMDAFDSECPRCHGKGLPESARETPAAKSATAAKVTAESTQTSVKTAEATPATAAHTSAAALEAKAHQERLIAEALRQAQELNSPTPQNKKNAASKNIPAKSLATANDKKGSKQELLIEELLAKAAGTVPLENNNGSATSSPPPAPVVTAPAATDVVVIEDNYLPPPARDPASNSFRSLLIIGVLMLALGLGAVGYSTLILDAHITLESGKKVLNVGLQAQRHSGVIKGMLLAGVGVVFLALGLMKPKALIS